MSEPRIYKPLGEREVHMIGDCVGVCWNLRSSTKSIKGEDGETYRATVWKRDGEPYIDFVGVRTDERTGEYYERVDSPAEGGLDAKTASKLRDELLWAVNYKDVYGKKTWEGALDEHWGENYSTWSGSPAPRRPIPSGVQDSAMEHCG